MEPLTGMWENLKKTNNLPKGALITNCEAELQELMRQIDLMVHQKSASWEKERATMRKRLEIKDQENTLQKSTLDLKHREIAQLRKQVERVDEEHRNTIVRYEEQLEALRKEVTSMKRDYERLQRKYQKQTREAQHESQSKSTELEETTNEIQRLTAKIEEYRSQSKDWHDEKRGFVKQVESLNSQKKTLQEKFDLMQQQSNSFKSQLDRRREMLDTTELSLKSQITQLQGQLERARDTINGQDVHICRLKSSVEEAVTCQKRALKEKENSEDGMRNCQEHARKLEIDFTQLQLELQSRDDILRLTENDHQRLSKDVRRLEGSVTEKDHKIQKLEKLSQEEQVEQIRHLQAEVKQSKEEIKKYRYLEKSLKGELEDLKTCVKKTQLESEEMKKKLTSKTSAQIEKLEERNLNEREGLKKEVAEITAHLHQKNLSVTGLKERTTAVERQLREQTETLDRKNAEIQVSNAQLEALRLENRHLRRAALWQGNKDVDLAEAEGHLQDLQTAYRTSVTSLEEQNLKLQEDLEALKKELKNVEERTQNRIQATLKESQQTLHSMKHESDRRLTSVKLESQKKVEELQQRLNETVNQYENRIEMLRGEMSGLEDELNVQDKSIKRLGMENNVMSHFVHGVDTFVKAPPNRESNLYSSQGQPSPQVTEEDFLSDEEDELLESADVITAQFLADQQERTRELEDRLDQHIEGLKLETEATLRKISN